jgi:hypothetical protein
LYADRTLTARHVHSLTGESVQGAIMSRAFVNEDRGDDVPRVRFTLPPFSDPGYPRAAALALIEAACDGLTSEAEEATGYRWGEPTLRKHVQRLLEQEQSLPEDQQNLRLITVARRYLRSSTQ